MLVKVQIVRAEVRENGAMVVKERLQALVEHVDTRHPRVLSRAMKLRWGGLRTLEPNRPLVAAVLGLSAVVTGVAVHLGGRRGDGRRRVRWTGAMALSSVGLWTALWRWDAARWRRSHVMVVVDLPSDQLDDLVAELCDTGAPVQRWDRARRADGPRHGVSCRLRDLRRVNAAIDTMTGAST
jgi:hypothetical protein